MEGSYKYEELDTMEKIILPRYRDIVSKLIRIETVKAFGETEETISDDLEFYKQIEGKVISSINIANIMTEKGIECNLEIDEEITEKKRNNEKDLLELKRYEEEKKGCLDKNNGVRNEIEKLRQDINDTKAKNQGILNEIQSLKESQNLKLRTELKKKSEIETENMEIFERISESKRELKDIKNNNDRSKIIEIKLKNEIKDTEELLLKLSEEKISLKNELQIKENASKELNENIDYLESSLLATEKKCELIENLQEKWMNEYSNKVITIEKLKTHKIHSMNKEITNTLALKKEQQSKFLLSFLEDLRKRKSKRTKLMFRFYRKFTAFRRLYENTFISWFINDQKSKRNELLNEFLIKKQQEKDEKIKMYEIQLKNPRPSKKKNNGGKKKEEPVLEQQPQAIGYSKKRLKDPNQDINAKFFNDAWP